MKIKIIEDGYSTAVARMFNVRKSFGFHPINDDNIKPDLIVFTGGPDISPEIYGQTKLPGVHVNIERDKKELAIYQKYKDLPKVGICRGGQLLNVLCGGNLWQDINKHYNDHEVINLLSTGKYEAGESIFMTSSHHQMMIPGSGAEVIAIAQNASGDKGIATVHKSSDANLKPTPYDPEVIWYEKEKTLCFQGHPEYLNTRTSRDSCDYFFNLMNYFYG